MCGTSKCCSECEQKKKQQQIQNYTGETLARIVEPGDFEEDYPLQEPKQYLEHDPIPKAYEEDIIDPEQSFAEAQYPEVFTAESDGMAPWILPEDRIPIKLAISVYTTPIQQFGGFVLFGVEPRSAAWYNCNTGAVVIGLRGTAITNVGGAQDLLDDAQIALGSLCNLSLVQEASALVEDLMDQEIVEEIVFAGHSLGGTAAFCLAEKYPDTRAVSLNMGAAATNPVTKGPGPGRAIHYHIVGDAVSSHVAPEAAEIVRIAIRDTNFLSTYWTHQATRALASNVPWSYADADYEDELWQEFTGDFEAFKTIFPEFGVAVDFLSILRGRRFPEQIPIPGSTRALAPNAVSTEASWFNVVQDIGELAFQYLGGSAVQKAHSALEAYHDAKLLGKMRPFTKGFGRRMDDALLRAPDELHGTLRMTRNGYKKMNKLKKNLGFDRETQRLRKVSRKAQRRGNNQWADDLLEEHTRLADSMEGFDPRLSTNRVIQMEEVPRGPRRRMDRYHHALEPGEVQMIDVPKQRSNKVWHKRIGKRTIRKR